MLSISRGVRHRSTGGKNKYKCLNVSFSHLASLTLRVKHVHLQFFFFFCYKCVFRVKNVHQLKIEPVVGCYANQRMQRGCLYPPTKPVGRMGEQGGVTGLDVLHSPLEATYYCWKSL